MAVITKTVKIQTPDGICDAYVAYPESSTKNLADKSDPESFPAILLYMDAFGLRPYLHEMAQKLSSFGYFVLVPNFFYRTRPAPVTELKFPIRAEDMPEAVKVIMPLVQSFNPELGLRDAGAYLDYLAEQKNVNSKKIGITGYCMGGSMALRTAAQYADRISVAASFHAGNLATDAANSPHLLLSQIKAELYIAHADNDKSMPPEQIERLKKALDESRLCYQAEVYKEAAHGFSMADLPAYNKAALDLHWQKLTALFARCLSSEENK